MRSKGPAPTGGAAALPGGDGAPEGALAPGLYLIATPIGAARDITLRALDILRRAEVLAAEDTRSLRRLMDIHAIPLQGRPLWPYHDHNGPAMRPRLMAALAEGRSVAYAPEAGTPLVADPGYQLVQAAVAAGAPVHAAPGPSALLAALAVSGLPSDRFLFAGFPPAPTGARRRWLKELAAVPATLILYESPKRVRQTLGELCEEWGAERQAALCRELTKRFEEVRRGSLGDLAAGLGDDAPRGEIVLVVDRGRPAPVGQEGVEAMLRSRRGEMSLKAAVSEVAVETGLPRRTVYQAALRIERGEGEA